MGNDEDIKITVYRKESNSDVYLHETPREGH